MMKLKTVLGLLMCACFTLACGDAEVLEATFTSKVVQREICTEVVDDVEVVEGEDASEPSIECARYEKNHILRYKLIEDAEKRVWIKGWYINGRPHRAWLGSRDQEGGFFFTRTITSENESTGCINSEVQTLSLAFPYGVSGFAEVGGVCTPLEGRETIVNTTTAGCNENELGTIRTINKRWEEDPTCEENVDISFSDSDDE